MKIRSFATLACFALLNVLPAQAQTSGPPGPLITVPGSELGYGGTISINDYSAVPEPSEYGIMVGIMLFVLVFARRACMQKSKPRSAS